MKNGKFVDRAKNVETEIKSIQKELDRRTEKETEAEELISQLKFQEAMEVLEGMDSELEEDETEEIEPPIPPRGMRK